MIAETQQKTSSSSRIRGAAAATERQTPLLSPPPPGPAPLRRRPMAERGPRALRKARQFGWRTPEMAAVLVFSFLVSLALLYVTAYARVTLQGFEYARLAEQVKDAEQQTDDLQAQIDTLKDRHTVEANARLLHLEVAPPQALQFIDPAATAAAPAATTIPSQPQQQQP